MRIPFPGVKDPDCFKQQQEEIHASQTGWFAPGLAAEMEKLRLCGATARCLRGGADPVPADEELNLGYNPI